MRELFPELFEEKKMKTIEEKLKQARKAFLDVNRSEIGNQGPLIADAYYDALNAVLSLPLSERLTDEEREKIKQYEALMCEEIDKNFACGNMSLAQGYFFSVVILRDIFGADMFKKGGEQ